MNRRLIGVDVGGTKVSVASLAGGTLEGPHIAPTAAGERALIDEIVHAVEAAGGADAAAVGVGVPSVVELGTGRVKSSVNVKLADVPLKAVLEERLRMPVFVENDANCAALAEAHEDGRMVAQNLVMFTVGTGVGGGLVLGGRIYRGATGAAGEIGHTLIGLDLEHEVPAPQGFPQPGSLESLASGRALDALVARFGEQGADAAIRLLGERLGVGIANAINVFDPELVVIGGGVANEGARLLDPARETALRFTLPGVGDKTEIRLARHGAKAGVLGAALLARQELGDD